MTVLVRDILQQLDQQAPFRLAENWDNVGLLVGDPGREVRSLLIGLDPANSLVDEAIERGADTILTHHPVIFRPLSAINTSTPEGMLLEKAISNRISIIACHTNLDSARDGVSDILAERLGLSGLGPILPTGAEETETGLGRTGSYQVPMRGNDFIKKVMEVLDLPTLQIAGPLPEAITTVAVCGGSGSDFAEAAMKSGADVYITAEVKHNIARWAEEHRFCIIEGTHYATEQPATALLATKLETIAAANDWDIEILQTKTEKHPFVYMHKSDFTS